MTANDTQATEADVPVEKTTDTTEAQTSEASSQENEAPEVTQTKGTEEGTDVTTEVEATDTAEEQKLYAGKYKTVEDLESAYKNAESTLGKSNSEKAELTKVLNEAFLTSQPKQQVEEGGADEYDDDLPTGNQSSSSNDPVIQRLVVNDAVTRFAFSHPDANGETMQKVLSEDPNVKQIGDFDAKLEYAYLKSQSMSQSQAIKQAKKEGQNQATAKVVEKQTAQVESAKKAESIDEKAELKNKATTGTPDERKAARLEYYKKYL